ELYENSWFPRCAAQIEKEEATHTPPQRRRHRMREPRPDVEREAGTPVWQRKTPKEETKEYRELSKRLLSDWIRGAK
ncbi:hypothetical protein EV174_006992, partial [Coemansia sp. RSA 2320]